MGNDSGRGPAERVLLRKLALLTGLTLALAAATIYLLVQRANPDPRELVELAMSSEEVERAAIERLVAGGEGAWDSFPDPDVGRVMQRGVRDRDFRGVSVSSNEFGMREAEYAAEKPAGTTRVVLLGDSFVYGYKVEVQDRLGVFLQRFLVERGASENVEVLHLAASSWNILAETSYLRRQLTTLAPDLVVQVVVANDLDDAKGARGFGALGAYSPQVRRRVGGMLSQLSPPKLWSRRVQTYLMFGLDHESRERYAECAAELRRLADAVEAQGGRYLMLAAWESFNPMVAKHLASALAPEQVAYVPMSFTQDLRYRIDASDRHWNRAGHERIATLLYGLAQERALLPDLELPSWDEATAAVREIHDVGLAQSAFVAEYDASLLETASAQARATIDFTDLDREAVKQVTAGVFEGGRVAPFASLFLKRDGGDELYLRGTRFPGEALAGGRARVSIEGLEVGTLALSGTPLSFEARWPLPPETRDRPFLTVRIESDDYLYSNPQTGACAAFLLERVAID